MGLGRPAGLRRPDEFKRCYGRGRMYKNRLAVIHVADGEGEATRVGYSVSRKLGNAVERNRVRRRLREIVRHVYPFMRPGYDVVVAPRVRSKDVGFWALGKAVVRLFEEAGVLPAASYRVLEERLLPPAGKDRR